MVLYILQLERGAREQAKAKRVRVSVRPRQNVVYVFGVTLQRSLRGHVIVWAALMKSALQMVTLHVARPADHKMDAAFHSLFSLPRPQSKLYFQADVTRNIHSCLTWLFISELVEERSWWGGGG